MPDIDPAVPRHWLHCHDGRSDGLVLWAKINAEPTIAARMMTAIGTFETCRGALKMAAYRGRPEVSGAQAERRD
jgi:hypothetical protein